MKTDKPNELITREARRLAWESLVLHMTQKNMGIPNIDSAKADQLIEDLLNQTNSFYTRARLNIDAKQSAFGEALRAIGIETEMKTLELAIPETKGE